MSKFRSDIPSDIYQKFYVAFKPKDTDKKLKFVSSPIGISKEMRDIVD